jgi:hypothetical protein
MDSSGGLGSGAHIGRSRFESRRVTQSKAEHHKSICRKHASHHGACLKTAPLPSDRVEPVRHGHATGDSFKNL